LKAPLRPGRQAGDESGALAVPLDAIRPNPRQPRKVFEEGRLAELANSIRAGGVVQPIAVRREGSSFVIVCGERRWRAARLAGLTEIPAVVRDVHGLVGALVENLQRADLATSEEIAAVTELAEELGVAAAAEALGKSPQWVSKRRRVGKAPEFVRTFAESGGSADLEALYEVAKLAETDPDAARELMEAGGGKSTLRANARRARKDRSPEPDADAAAAASEEGRSSFHDDDEPGHGSGREGRSRRGPEREVAAEPYPASLRPSIDEFFSDPPAGEAGPGDSSDRTRGALPTGPVQSVRMDGDAVIIEGAGVALRLSDDLERELFELIRERLTR
jgi:ParB family chromosome partitioning protein